MSRISNEFKGSLESRKDFKDTPTGQYRYWMQEITASEKMLREFRKLGTKVVTRFKGGSQATRDSSAPDERGGAFRLNLFHSNVITLQSMLYGNLPKVDVSRRHDDPNNDVGRVAALILERLLNNDVQDNGKEYNSVLRAVLQDRLLPGLGCARVRYTYEADKSSGQITKEDCPIDYYHWRDVAWGWGRSFSDIPWVGFRTFLSKDELTNRFGDDAADKIELKDVSVVPDPQDEPAEANSDSPWRKGEVWEIWDKEKKQIVWISPGYDKVLDTKDDTLGLSGFYPCPPFLLANQTTSLYVPVSDFYLAQDLYNEIDTLQTRISIITEAVKVVGVYDRSAEGIQRMFKEGTDNDLIPVDNWALFAEKGGIEGQIDWVPIQQISETLIRLRELRTETIGLLQQVTGMADIMRGDLGSQYEGVGQSELKAKFGSVRIQALQDEFARFASDLLQLKAEVIGRHFEPENIAQYANMDESFDRDIVPQAVQLLKNPDAARMRVEIRPESVAMVDYAQLKQERTEYITALATFLQSSGPLLEMEPAAKPFLLRLLQWGLAGFKGSNEIEGIIDKAVMQSEKQKPQEKDDGTKAEKAKQEGQIKLEQLKHKNAMEMVQANMQADLARRKADLEADKQTSTHEMQMDIQATMANMHSDLAEIRAKLTADLEVEEMQAQTNIATAQVSAQMEIAKDAASAQLDIEKQAAQTEQKLKEIKEQGKNAAKKETKTKD